MQLAKAKQQAEEACKEKVCKKAKRNNIHSPWAQAHHSHRHFHPIKACSC